MYRLRWGSYTWIPALAGTAIIGFIALFLSTRVMGEAWYGTYYVPMLGYFVMVSVCQAHYFKSNPGPNLAGIWRQGVSIVGAIALFYFHRWAMGSLFGIPAKLVLPGQLTFILIGFFAFAWDDSMARGQFAKWIRIDALKAVFWYAVIWVLWYLVFAMPGGLVSALGTFSQLRMNVFLAIFQWMIILQLMMGIIWKDILQGLRFPNNYLRGVSLLVANATVGVALSYITYLIGSAMAAGGHSEPLRRREMAVRADGGYVPPHPGDRLRALYKSVRAHRVRRQEVRGQDRTGLQPDDRRISSLQVRGVAFGHLRPPPMVE